MKLKNLLLVPLVFVSGMAVVVLLQAAGLLQVSLPSRADNQTTGANITDVRSSDSRANSSAAPVAAEDTSGRAGTDTQDSLAQKGDSSTNVVLASQVEELRKQVQSATVERDLMRREVEELSELVSSATESNAFLPSGESPDSTQGGSTNNANEFNAGNASRFNRGFGQPDGDEQYNSLVAAGIDPNVALEIKQRTDQWSLERLELIDQASREGWRRSDEFQDRLSELQETQPDVRSELGDADYDQYLYVSGESNRVQIASIIDGSAAQIAGIENGDILRSYASERMFTTRELQGATREGSRGELVSVTVERAGQFVTVDIPRGPLGVTLTGLRVEPDGF